MTWIAGWEQIIGNSAGSFIADPACGWKLLLHRTQGSTIAGAVGAYRQNNTWPHFTVSYGEQRIVQHLPLTSAGRALRNLSGGVETNRAKVIQIEMTGLSEVPMTDDEARWMGKLIAKIQAARPEIPLQASVTWVTYPDSYGLGAPQRLSDKEWIKYAGILGHQHAPENTHGDPGWIPIGVLLAAANPQPTPQPQPDLEEFEMDYIFQVSGTAGQYGVNTTSGFYMPLTDVASAALTSGANPLKVLILENATRWNEARAQLDQLRATG